jgi:hypothetical protein
VHSLVFLASHCDAAGNVDRASIDALSRVERDLKLLQTAMPGNQRPWMLLFAPQQLGRTAINRLAQLALQVFPWSLKQLFDLFPAAKHTFASSSGVHETSLKYQQMYYLFHSALALWWRQFGEAMHPQLKYFWRLEPDVQLVGSGGWAALMARSPRMHADVLLPELTFQNRSARLERVLYSHWELNKQYVESIEPAQRAWSLVCVGRYSRHFILDVMWPQWANGTLVYEEIFLPTSCLARADCSVSSFGSLVDVRHVRYRPPWECDEWVRKAHRHSHLAFWHPVKDTTCAQASMLETGVRRAFDVRLDAQALPPPSPPKSPPRAPPGFFGSGALYGNGAKTNHAFLFKTPPPKFRPGAPRHWKRAAG